MRTIFLICFSTALLMGNTYSQGPCVNVKIETPAVSKPTNGNIIAATCSSLVIGWKGSSNQSYLAQATYFNTVTNKTDTVAGTNINCDNSFNCTATIPVSPGTKISWSVEASALIDGRTFYSYPFRGEQDYLIPSCVGPRPAVVQEVKPKLNNPVNKLSVFPNPVTGILTVNWSNEYKGDAVINISNAAGKEIRNIAISKTQNTFTEQVKVNTFAPGVYYLQIGTVRGELFSTTFVKE